MPELSISSEKVCFLIVKAREFDVEEGSSEPDSGSNATDDRMIDVLEEWDDMRTEDFEEHAGNVAAYLLGEPLLGDYLEEGLAQFGMSCAEFEIGRLWRADLSSLRAARGGTLRMTSCL